MMLAREDRRRLARAALGVGLAYAAFGAGPAAAQDKRLAGRLDPETAAAVTRLVDSVRTAGLPSEPLVGVALEGASRRASGDRIVSAVREYATALGTARGILGESAVSDEITSAAGVIVAGVPAGVVSEYRIARPGGPLTVPFVVLADLVARGVPAATAADALGSALRGGAQDDELTELRRQIERDILAGARPAAAMKIRARDLPTASSPGVPPARPRTPRVRRPGPP